MAEPGPSRASAAVRKYKTTYNSKPGTLLISQTTLNWVPDVAGAEKVPTQQLSRIISMFTSKAGAKNTSAKLNFVEDRPKGGLTFKFTAVSPDDLSERQDLQDFLIPIIAENKQRNTASIAGEATAAQGMGAGAAALTSDQAGGPSSASASASNSRSTTPAPSARSNNTGATYNKEEVAVRLRVLAKNPTLKALHRDLAVAGLISDADFWDGREHLIEQERLLMSQRPGIPSQLLDDRFGFNSQNKNDGKNKSVGTGFGIAQTNKRKPDQRNDDEIKINITRELQESVFREFPIVQDIYVSHVGTKETQTTEEDFWSRYFRSKLWDRHRASARAGGSTNIRADTIFDQYLEAPDDSEEPREAPKRSVDMFLDLAATEEDHAQTGNGKDYTMQAGKQKGTLPLIRRFNDHSNRLVALDEEDAASDVIGDGMSSAEARLYSEIDMDELRSYEQTKTISLDVQDQQDQFDGKTSERNDIETSWLKDRTPQDVRKLIMASRTTLRDWEPNLPRIIPALPPAEARKKPSVIAREGATVQDFTNARKAADKAVAAVATGVEEARQATEEQDPIPQAIMSQVLTCHNAHTEFLRQFWSAVLPTPPGTLGAPTPEQKMTKARKMAKFLSLMKEKVDSVVQSAAQDPTVDTERVREALAPTLQAAEKALAQFATMTRSRV